MAEQRDPIQQKIDRWRKNRVTKDMVMDIVAPNSYNDGLTIENVFRDAAPTVADYLDWAEGKDIAPEELAWDFVLSFPGLPMATRALKKFMKFAKKAGKGGFIRNPQFNWKSLTPQQKVATDKAIKDWNYGVKHNKELYDPRPENIPIDVEYEQPRMNKINDFFSNQYKFTPKTFNDIGLMEKNPNVVTQAILPENINDAAYLRHNPAISNYDAVLKANRTQIGNDANKGSLKSGMPYSRTAADPRYDDQYVIQYRTNTGDYADQGSKAKRAMLLQLEELFPGYIKAMEGR